MTADPDSTTRRRVPRLAEWLAQQAARQLQSRETALGDLLEEFDDVASTRGTRAARRWYWRQAAALTRERIGVATANTGRAVQRFIRPPGDHHMRTLIHEAAIAARSLRRQPLVTAIVIGTLALGLGANAATFGLIDRLMLRPYTFEGVDRLAMAWEMAASDQFHQARESVSAGTFVDFRRDSTALEQITAFDWWDVNLSGGDRPERVQGHQVTGEFFSVLGVNPAAGRLLDTTDAMPGGDPVAVLSEALWQRRFGGSPDVVGQTIQLDGTAFTVVGVAGGTFDFPYRTEVWAPLVFDPADPPGHRSRYLTVIGRIPDGGTLDAAAAELTSVYQRIRREHPDETANRSMSLVSFADGMIDTGLPQILAVWQAGAVLVLLIGCVNIANLLLARGAERRRELAVRLAIGAGRGRIIRQLLIENAIVAVMAVPAALLVAWLGFHLIRTAMPASLVRFLPGWSAMGVDGRVVLMTFVAALGTAVVFGLLPALRSSRPGLTAALRDGGRSTSAGEGRNRLRRGLVIAQVAVALPLLILSGLSAVGIQRFALGPQGYDPDDVLRLRTILPADAYPDEAARRAFVDQFLDEAAKVSGIDVVATTSVAPATTSNQSRFVIMEGETFAANETPPSANFRAVSPGYLRTMSIPLQQGRHFTAADREDTQGVAIVSRSLAERHWPGESPIGQRVALGREADNWFTVVGVAGDTIDDWFSSRNVPTVYVPVAQSPSSAVIIVARSSREPAGLADELRAALARVSPAVAAFDVATMRAAIHERTTGLRFVAGIMLTFGLVALVLAAFGIYGVMAHYVAQRRHDIGVRMALGAGTGVVLRQTMGEGARLSAIGVVLGLGIGIALARVMEQALFGIASLDPALVAGVTSALLVVATAACLIPARHATRIDPISALRGD